MTDEPIEFNEEMIYRMHKYYFATISNFILRVYLGEGIRDDSGNSGSCTPQFNSPARQASNYRSYKRRVSLVLGP